MLRLGLLQASVANAMSLNLHVKAYSTIYVLLSMNMSSLSSSTYVKAPESDTTFNIMCHYICLIASCIISASFQELLLSWMTTYILYTTRALQHTIISRIYINNLLADTQHFGKSKRSRLYPWQLLYITPPFFTLKNYGECMVSKIRHQTSVKILHKIFQLSNLQMNNV